jgi:beta-lactamase regulating signal transducer with metallopeptidase domain
MTALIPLLAQPWVPRLGRVLIHFVWQGAAIALLLAVARRFLARSTAQLRYLLAATALLACGIAPVATWIVLAPVPRAPVAPVAAPPAISLAEITLTSAPAHLLPHPVLSSITSSRFPNPDYFHQLTDEALPGIVAFWFAGVAFLALRLALAWTFIQRLRLSGTTIADAALRERFARLLRRLRISAPVRVLQSALVEVPTLIGWLRPVILVPAAVLAGLTPDQLDAILAHELAHVRRWDYLVNLLQTVIETALFYHPAVWWISRQVREERENCCDDIAVETTQDRLLYARALAQLAENCATPLALAASDGPLLRRIQRLVGVEDRRRSWLPLLAMLAAAAILGLPVIGQSSEPAKVTPSAASAPGAWSPAHQIIDISSLDGFKTAQSMSSVGQPSQAIHRPPIFPPDLVRVEIQVVEMSEEDYRAHRAQIDAALRKGNIDGISKLHSFDLLSEPPVLAKPGERATMELVRVFPFPVKFERVSGKLEPLAFERRSIGVRFPLTATLKNGLIQVGGKLTLTSFEGFTQTGEKTFSPTFRSCDVYLFEEMKSGETRGILVPGLQTNPGDDLADPQYGTIVSSVPKPPRRVLLFLNARTCKDIVPPSH